jgi:hypothetical protein
MDLPELRPYAHRIIMNSKQRRKAKTAFFGGLFKNIVEP